MTRKVIVMDWIGNTTSIFATHGASNHSTTDPDYFCADGERDIDAEVE